MDWDKISNYLGILGATLQDTGNAYRFHDANALRTLIAERKKAKEEEEQKQSYNNAVSGIVGKFYNPPTSFQPSVGADGLPNANSIDPQGLRSGPGFTGITPAYQGGILSNEQAAALMPFLRGMTPDKGMGVVGSILENAMKSRDPIKAGPGDVILSPDGSRTLYAAPFAPQSVAQGATLIQNGKPIYENPAKSDVLSPEAYKQQVGLRLAGRTNINNNLPSAEKAYDQEFGKLSAQRTNDMIKAGEAARQKIDMLTALGRGLQETPYAGPAADYLTNATMLMNQLGVSDTDTSSAEFVRSLSNQMALLMRNPAGGAGMPGNLSNTDRDFLTSTVAGLRNSRGGSQKMVQIAIRMEQRKYELAHMAQLYAEKHGGLDSGFEDLATQYNKEHPIFPEAAPAQRGGASGLTGDPLVDQYLQQ